MNVLEHHERKTLLPLYLYITGVTEPDKHDMYFAYSGKKYTAKVDFLLRNELRLLNNELESFIAECEATERSKTGDIQTDVWLLERMLSAKQYRLFEITLQKRTALAEQQADFNALYLLQQLQFIYLTRHREVNEKDYAYLLNKLKNENHHLLYAEEQNGLIQIQQQFLERTLKAIAPGLKADKVTPGPAFARLLAFQKQLKNYNALNATLYTQHGVKKIESLKKLAALNKKLSAVRPQLQQKLPGIYGNIGVEYFIMDNYTEADRYYELAIKNSSGQPSFDLLFNYGTNLLALDQYDKFLKLFKAYEQDVDRDIKTKYRFRFFAAIAYLFVGQPAQSFKLLEHDIHNRPLNEYYYYRQVYAMVYYETGDLEVAKRELENLQQSYRKRPTQTKYDKPLTALLLKFIQTRATRANKERYRKSLNEIYSTIEDMARQKVTYSVLVSKWLSKQVERSLKK